MMRTHGTELGDRFEIEIDGAPAGVAQFLDQEGRRIFFHTQIDDAYACHGLAGQLVAEALDATRATGLRVVPVCPYVKRFLAKHEEYADLADPVTPEAIRLVEQLTS
ncbi:MAG: GNAT family N-acetyltransferase [Nocardioides sp.]